MLHILHQKRSIKFLHTLAILLYFLLNKIQDIKLTFKLDTKFENIISNQFFKQKTS